MALEGRAGGPPAAGQAVVLDTNVVLDLLLFDDPAVQPLRQALAEGRLRWLATAGMREEFVRVLGYPQIARQLAAAALQAAALLEAFDRLACPVDAAAATAIRCKDADDQKFIDLAVAHRATLLSKDKAVLALRRRLAGASVALQLG